MYSESIDIKIGLKSLHYERTDTGDYLITAHTDDDRTQDLDCFLLDQNGIGDHVTWGAGTKAPTITPWPRPAHPSSPPPRAIPFSEHPNYDPTSAPSTPPPGRSL